MHNESLELRRLFAATLTDGLLSIMGTSDEDTVYIAMENAKVSVYQWLGNHGINEDEPKPEQLIGTFSGVRSIRVEVGDGSDNVFIDSSITAPARIYMGDGDDVVFDGSGNDVVYAGAGGDQLFPGGGANALFAGEGNDRFNLVEVASSNYIEGQGGVDSISFHSTPAINLKLSISKPIPGAPPIYAATATSALTSTTMRSIERYSGSKNDDVMQLTVREGTLGGWSYNDPITGYLDGSIGNDVIKANVDAVGIGQFYLNGSNGNDRIDGRASSQANPVLYGSIGDDVLIGGSGDDTLSGMDGQDALFGNAGRDYLDGGDENDYIEGSSGSDNIFGGNGDNTLVGGTGNDRIYGGNGNDVIYARDKHRDWIYGGEGRDRAAYDNLIDYGYTELFVDSIEVNL